jgi:hypothetical protein
LNSLGQISLISSVKVRLPERMPVEGKMGSLSTVGLGWRDHISWEVEKD